MCRAFYHFLDLWWDMAVQVAPGGVPSSLLAVDVSYRVIRTGLWVRMILLMPAGARYSASTNCRPAFSPSPLMGFPTDTVLDLLRRCRDKERAIAALQHVIVITKSARWEEA